MWRGMMCMAGVVGLWSFVPVLMKWLIPVMDPFTIAFLRLAQGTVTLLAVYLVGGHGLREIRLHWWHAIGGLGVAMNYALFALSLSYTTASAGVLVVQVQYVVLAVLAAVVLHEKLGGGKIAGIFLVSGGVAWIVATRTDISSLLAPRYAHGNILMLFSGIGWGLYALSNKALVHRATTLGILLPMLAMGTAVTGALAATRPAFLAAPSVGSLATLLVLGVVATGGAFVLVSEGMKRLSAAFAGTVTGVTPLTQIMLAHFILGEPLSGRLLIGGGLILSGVLGMVYAEKGSQGVFRPACGGAVKRAL
jgi:drug/metabolite transporter (DMT)-like permease